MSDVINLFSTPIFKVKIVPSDNEFQVLDNLLYSIFDKSEEGIWALETGKSTGQHGLQLHENIAMYWLVKQVYNHVCKFWGELDYAHGANITLPTSWANLHKQGHVTGEHSHCGGSQKAHISAVYYFKKSNNSGNIEFRDPLETIHSLSPRHNYNVAEGNAGLFEVNVEQFDLILFPSWLKHKTKPNESKEDRVAISMNFIGTWEY
jgi:uncharacterized protein (TIGR02466 family)